MGTLRFAYPTKPNMLYAHWLNPEIAGRQMEYVVRKGNSIATLLFCTANLFLLVVPGSVLLLLGPERGAVLPAPIVRSIYPFTIFPFEKLLVVDVLDRLMGRITSIAEFDHVGFYLQQFFVLAVVLFPLMLVLVIVQMRAGALYLEKGEPNILQCIRTLLILLVMRPFVIQLILIDPSSMPDNRPGPEVMLAIIHALAPELLIFTTCMFAGVICLALGLAYRRIISA